ncbi:4-(cytidine 5'-diphospho)-2-C-methyl-D-erythritol kinase [Mesorhizobium sp. SB112]|uniref:4-(cytidine 5'-diphospho)-2-C-methyl-D-erythritol kinase n=1 Tax=Mesorhizobium sp. SB112 TaxID=3151853 RepID=UPI003263360A
MDPDVSFAVEHAPAKVNLALHVTGRRADGYHLLDSLIVFTAHGDRLTFSPAQRDSFSVTGPFSASVPNDEGNLVLRARVLLREAFPEARKPVSIALEKNLPVASGIGGGSSDAAATLRALARHWGLEGQDRIDAIALSLGADVPMCLTGRPLLASGIGDIMQPLNSFPELNLVLVNPGIALSTPAVFKALQSTDNAPLPALPSALDFTALIEWLETTRNDLQDAATQIVPEIGDSLSALRTNGSAFARMSGSGATCFGLFENAENAAKAAASISEAQPDWFVSSTKAVS